MSMDRIRTVRPEGKRCFLAVFTIGVCLFLELGAWGRHYILYNTRE
ncbi:MAG: hypothetical protein HY717_09400 [Planctomycetes bacterium]|nr:hypothetical protein [Planctomycetota bacterium]